MTQKYTPPKDVKNDFYMICDMLIEGKQPNQIREQLNISRQDMNYYLKPLRINGIIKKVGYATWDIDIEKLKAQTCKKNLKSTPRVTRDTPPEFLHVEPKKFLHVLNNKKLKELVKTPDTVRGHGFVITLEIPERQNWKDRKEILIRTKTEYKDIPQGQRIEVNGRKVWLTNDSVVVYMGSHSYFSQTAREARQYIIYDFQQIIQKVETLLRTPLRINKEYKFRISKKHYALIKNEIAHQYNAEHKKLCMRDEGDGVIWLTIDDSFNFGEMEFQHVKTAERDTDNFKPYINDIRQHPELKPSFLAGQIGAVADNLNAFISTMLNRAEADKEYSMNIKAHIGAIQDLGKGVNELVTTVKELKEIKAHAPAEPQAKRSYFEAISPNVMILCACKHRADYWLNLPGQQKMPTCRTCREGMLEVAEEIRKLHDDN